MWKLRKYDKVCKMAVYTDYSVTRHTKIRMKEDENDYSFKM